MPWSSAPPERQPGSSQDGCAALPAWGQAAAENRASLSAGTPAGTPGSAASVVAAAARRSPAWQSRRPSLGDVPTMDLDGAEPVPRRVVVL